MPSFGFGKKSSSSKGKGKDKDDKRDNKGKGKAKEEDRRHTGGGSSKKGSSSRDEPKTPPPLKSAMKLSPLDEEINAFENLQISDDQGGASSSSASRPARNEIRGLKFIHIWEDGSLEEVQEDTREFALLAYAVWVAVSLLESHKGIKCMVLIGKECEQHWPAHTLAAYEQDMTVMVRAYLRGLRNSFPTVYLDHRDPLMASGKQFGANYMVPSGEAMVQWDHFNAKRAMRVRISGRLARLLRQNIGTDVAKPPTTTDRKGRTVLTMSRDEWRAHVGARSSEIVFLVAVTLLHELGGHGFRFYLSMNDEEGRAKGGRTRTPPGVNGGNGEWFGEAGTELESLMFGGRPIALSNLDNPEVLGATYLVKHGHFGGYDDQNYPIMEQYASHLPVELMRELMADPRGFTGLSNCTNKLGRHVDPHEWREYYTNWGYHSQYSEPGPGAAGLGELERDIVAYYSTVTDKELRQGGAVPIIRSTMCDADGNEIAAPAAPAASSSGHHHRRRHHHHGSK